MAEYIKRTEVMKICRDYSRHCFNSNDAYGQDVADRIEIDVIKIPTADVVEVVRCRDCRYFTKGMAVGMCKRVEGKPILPCCYDNFCKYGERKDA